MEFKNYYAILELSYPSTPLEIKKAYRKASLKWHPDKNPSPDASKMMIEINEAYFILKDDLRRNRYNLEYEKLYFQPSATHTNTDKERHCSNTQVNDDIKEAREYAQKIVAEFFKSMKQTTQTAAKGAFHNMLPFIIAAIILTLISLLIQSSI